jgi:hypothetical protein
MVGGRLWLYREGASVPETIKCADGLVHYHASIVEHFLELRGGIVVLMLSSSGVQTRISLAGSPQAQQRLLQIPQIPLSTAPSATAISRISFLWQLRFAATSRSLKSHPVSLL